MDIITDTLVLFSITLTFIIIVNNSKNRRRWWDTYK